MAREITDLTDRVTGMETLLADLVTNGRIVIQLPPSAVDERLARTVERESVRAQRAWRRS
jgi:hypothetical protein